MNSADIRQKFRNKIIYYFSYVGIFFLVSFGILHLFSGSLIIGTSELFLGLLAILNLIFFKFNKNADFAASTILLLMFGAIAVLYITGGVEGTGIFWSFTYPMLAYFIFSKKIANYWMLFLFLELILLATLTNFGYVSSPYTFAHIRQLLAALGAVTVLIYIQRDNIEKSDSLLDENILKIDSANSILRENEVKLKESQEKLLSKSKNEDDIKLAVLNILEDLDEERKKIQEAKAKDDAILSSIGDGIIFTDENGNVNFINHAGEESLGWDSDALIGKKFVELIPIQDTQNKSISIEERPMLKSVREKIKISGRYYYERHDKSKFPVEITVSPVEINGKIIGTIEVFRDVTHDLEIEEAKTQFLSMASHELRTPLTAIDGLVSMILDGEYGKISEGLVQPLKDVSSASERLINLVNDLLSVSRMQAGRLKYVLTEFSIKQPIDQTVNLLSVIAGNKGITLKSENVQDVMVQADLDKVKEILNNLIGNSIKFTDKGGITVTSEKIGNLLTIYIKDTGIGIKEEDKSKLFGTFQQFDSGKGRPQGSGLGLHISREITRKMGGDLLLISSEINKGSIFAFSIPLSGTEEANRAKEVIGKEAEAHPDQKLDQFKSDG